MSQTDSFLCAQHMQQVDQSYSFQFHDGADLQILQNMMIIVVPGQTGTMTLHVRQPVVAQVQIFCAQKVDVTIRLIILLADQVDLKISAIMCGNYGVVNILSLCMLAEHQKVIISTRQQHCGQHSQSRLVLQGLLTDHARLEYDGMIRIEPNACGTYALQNNKNILLSSTSSAVSIPNIEVLHHDVQCYHGSAIGKFDASQMQYMQSRGLQELVVKQLLVQALFAQVLQGYKNKDVILESVYKKL